jgi:hypothetical protein
VCLFCKNTRVRFTIECTFGINLFLQISTPKFNNAAASGVEGAVCATTIRENTSLSTRLLVSFSESLNLKTR